MEALTTLRGLIQDLLQQAPQYAAQINLILETVSVAINELGKMKHNLFIQIKI
jgi:hypothetical protein